MFFRSYLLPITSIILSTVLSFSVAADNDSTSGYGMETIVLENASDVSSAIAELKSELEQQGFIIPLTVNHSAAAARVHLDLAPNQVIFARPPRFLEKRLLRKSDTIGLDLPLKFLVHEDTNGAVILSYNTLGYLIDRHEVGIRDFVLRLTDKLIEQFGTNPSEGHGVVSVKSSQSIEDTVQALLDAISVNPEVSIPLVLKYGKIRNSFPVLIVFGNPNVGTPLMQADPRAGIDLPIKILIWGDHNGQVSITYNDPHFIAGRIDLKGQDDRLDAIANVLNNLAMKGAGENP